MTLAHTERLLKLLRTNGVNYFKSEDIEIRLGAVESPTAVAAVGPEPTQTVPRGTPRKPPETAAAAPPVEMKIPHHLNQVVSMLKLDDNSLAEALFPDGGPIDQREVGN